MGRSALQWGQRLVLLAGRTSPEFHEKGQIYRANANPIRKVIDSVKSWWARSDSNQGPVGYEPTALPLSYESREFTLSLPPPPRIHLDTIPAHPNSKSSG